MISPKKSRVCLSLTERSVGGELLPGHVNSPNCQPILSPGCMALLTAWKREPPAPELYLLAAGSRRKGSVHLGSTQSPTPAHNKSTCFPWKLQSCHPYWMVLTDTSTCGLSFVISQTVSLPHSWFLVLFFTEYISPCHFKFQSPLLHIENVTLCDLHYPWASPESHQLGFPQVSCFPKA